MVVEVFDAVFAEGTVLCEDVFAGNDIADFAEFTLAIEEKTRSNKNWFDLLNGFYLV